MLTRQRSPLYCAAVGSGTCVGSTQIAPKGLAQVALSSDARAGKIPHIRAPPHAEAATTITSLSQGSSDYSTAARSRYLPAQRHTAFRGVALQRPTPDIRSANISAPDLLPTIPHPNATVKSHAQCLPRHCAATTQICWPGFQPNNDRRSETTSSGMWVQRPAHRRHLNAIKSWEKNGTHPRVLIGIC